VLARLANDQGIFRAFVAGARAATPGEKLGVSDQRRERRPELVTDRRQKLGTVLAGTLGLAA
jgi:hypothetical protein